MRSLTRSNPSPRVLTHRTHPPCSPSLKALIGNIGWFGAASLFFGALPGTSGGWMVPEGKLRTHPLYTLYLKHSLRFLGGMNFALTALSAMLLAARWPKRPELFNRPAERRILFLSFALAHFTQFFLQIPVWLSGKLRGVLLFIFAMDLAQALANFACAERLKPSPRAATPAVKDLVFGTDEAATGVAGVEVAAGAGDNGHSGSNQQI